MKAIGFFGFIAFLGYAGLLLDPMTPVVLLGVGAGVLTAGRFRKGRPALGRTSTIRVRRPSRHQNTRSSW